MKRRYKAQGPDLLIQSWSRNGVRESKIVTSYRCSNCQKFCQVEYVQQNEFAVRVSKCCKVKPKVTRYVYKEKNTG